MEVTRRVEAPRPVKPGVVKGRTARQPLAGVGNKILNNISNRDHTLLGKPLKPAKKKSAEKVVTKPKAEEVQVNNLVEAFSAASLPNDVDDIDTEDRKNPQLVSQYVNDIYQYLRQVEAKYPIRKNFLDSQIEVTSRMRAVLVDWLVQVHMKFHLLQETLYLTVAIMDRYLQVEKVRRSKLQLVGVASMFIAAKYEEIYAPEVGDFVYITDNTYPKGEILKMEQHILKTLDFLLGKPLPLHFLRRYSKAGNVDSTMHTLAKYLMELVLLEYDMAHYLPSIVSAAALYLSIKLLEDGPWSSTLAFYSTYSEKDILPIVSAMCKAVLKNDPKFQAIRCKYASNKLMRISVIPEMSSPLITKMARMSHSN